MRANNILPFPQPGERVVLDSGVIGRGENRGRVMFWLDYIDRDGATTVWTGFARSEALAAAREWTKWGTRLVDKTGGAQ